MLTLLVGAVTGVLNFLGDLALVVVFTIGHICVRDWAWRLPFMPVWAEEVLFIARWSLLGGLIIEHVGNFLLSLAGIYLTGTTQKSTNFPTLNKSTNIVAAVVIACIMWLFIHMWMLLVPLGILAIIYLVVRARKKHP